MTRKITLSSLSDYPEVPVSEGEMLLNETGTWRFVSPAFTPRPSPCFSACPLTNDIPRIMSLLAAGDEKEAWETLALEDPFPALLGRVCPGFCMADCNRKEFDERVSIREVERFLGDRFLNDGPPPVGRPSSGKTAAIVGSGPAGLSAAYFLALLGHAVTIYEKEAHPGGVPRIGIPSYRLSRRVLDAVVDMIRGMGVEILTGREIAPGDLAGLSAEHDALFIAPGAHVSTGMGIEGEGLPGVAPGLSLLKDVHNGGVTGMSGDFLVVGGGNTALDTARVLMRLGARPTVVYRRDRDSMPAFADEIEEAVEEGIPMEFFRAPIEIRRTGDDRLRVTLVGLKPGEPDASGRPRPVPIAGSEQAVEVDGLFSAVGETIDGALGAAVDDLITSKKVGPIIIGGDAGGLTRTVAHAAASGKAAAMAIDRALTGGPKEAGARGFRAYVKKATSPDMQPVGYAEINTDYFEKMPALVPQKASPEGRTHGWDEVSRTAVPDEAAREASRCFACGSCIGCEVCATFCPDFSVLVEKTAALIDYTYCKGCGICARECPRGVISMQDTGGPRPSDGT